MLEEGGGGNGEGRGVEDGEEEKEGGKEGILRLPVEAVPVRRLEEVTGCSSSHPSF